MRKWASVTAVLLAVAFPAAALADSPPEIYSDFAEDGALSCGHSRSALKEVLNDASIHQYGDPLTLIGLKLAVRQQLAGGCRRGSRRSDRPLSFFTPAGTGVPPSGSTESSANSTKSSTGEAKRSGKRTQGQPVPPPPATAGVATGGQQNGRMVLLGVILLLVVLASGGWAARRALTD
jgi:hypothetical protein